MKNERQGKTEIRIWLTSYEVKLIESMINNPSIIGMVIKKAMRRGDFEK